MDYYELLGVPRNATDSELKKAYKKQSMQHHPDRNGGSDEKFKQINEAYSALKDPQKRQMYDQYGTADPQQAQAQQQSHFSNAFGGANFEDIFGQMFGANPNMRRHMRNQDITIGADIDLEDIVTGKEVIATYRLPSGREETVEIKLPPGVQAGDRIRYAGMGSDAHSQAPRGDLHVLIRVRKHPEYTQDGINLYIDKKLNLFDFILGTNITIQTIHGRTLSVNVPAGSNPGTVFSVGGQGLPNRRQGQTGNLYIKVNGVTPKINDELLREKITKIQDETKTT